ncbi:MAG: MG2 domain-containing protein [Planctomycetaceae bacterium]
MLRGLLPLVPAVLGLSIYLVGAEPDATGRREQANQLFQEGNYNEAYDIVRDLTLDPKNSGTQLADDLSRALACLAQLQRQNEIDAFREAAVKVHAGDWRLLARAAESLVNGEHYGFVVAGAFQRGSQRGGGQWAESTERDRVRALQLLVQARPLVDKDEDKAAVAQFYWQLAQAVQLGRGGGEAWRLQALTDLTQLPDYDEVQRWRGRWGWGGGGQGKGAPVDADGNPILYSVPDSWDAATNDGQRWRWALSMMVENNPSRKAEAAWTLASFLHSQFGVQTMQQWGIVLPQGGPGTGDDKNESGPYALHSLSEDETIARLATGVKRFKLPDEFNPIRIFQELARGESYAEAALGQLAQIFEDRQQYPRAAGYWKESIERFRDDSNKSKQGRLDQIIGNWGRFENTHTQPAGQGATVEYRFRNGKQVHLEAHLLQVRQLLTDVQQYLKSSPQQLDWNKIQIDNIGQRLVQQNETKYRGERVAAWDVDLDPRPEHFDRRITITTPLQRAGAYLVEARLENGNTSRIVLWLDDTVIVKKPLDGQTWYFVADAVTGQPVAGADVEFFGWKGEQVENRQNRFRVVTSNFAEKTDRNGQVLANPKLLQPEFQWIAVARTRQGRFAHLGFSGVWYSDYQREEYGGAKVYFISDRPVYRPAQKVQFKFWLRKTEYDQPDASDYANQKFTVVINDPQGVEVHKQEYTTDEFGGLAGEYALPDEAPLGVYSATVVDFGGGSFRVEEYKKPEYEVTVEAPDKPVMLGEKVTALIKAKYYFGAPVTQATVKFKVQRTGKDARWFPIRPWDWLYGNGYWWFAPDYTWYPGFQRWGCFGPVPPWWGHNPEPPELVLDQEVPIGADGTVKVEIDTALAKELHGDEDHEYSITAEVVDQSRRTIVGTGSVLVAREPFKVFAWTDRGYYRVGDTIHASFQARTPDGKPVKGDGQLKLLKITYDAKQQPVENVAQEWDLATNADGQSTQQMTASEPGQYRLSYTVKGTGLRAEGQDVEIEGGYVFTITGDTFNGSEFQFNDLELIADKAEYAPGEKVKLLINTNRVGSTVLLFARPSGGIYVAPEILRLDGKSTTHELTVTAGDMPNFYIEALTISGGEVHTVAREVIVPPEKRVLDVVVDPSAAKYKPGEDAKVKVKLTDIAGQPYKGSVVLAMYDRSVDAIAGGSNVPEIREFFWKWRRSYYAHTEHSLSRWFSNLLKEGETPMGDLGAFGGLAADQEVDFGRTEANADRDKRQWGMMGGGMRGDMRAMGGMPMPASAAPMREMAADGAMPMEKSGMSVAQGAGEAPMVQPTVRSQFADTAYWNAAITTADDGTAEVSLTMPENLTGWKLRAWGMGQGTRVGEATTEVVTFKNLLVRLEAPRFFVETDEVVLSAIVHNYLETEKSAEVQLVLEGGTLAVIGQGAGAEGQEANASTNSQLVTIPAGGEVRVDWRVKAIREGEAVVTMKALTDEESDAMQMQFPVFVHGMLKTESFSGVVRHDQPSGTITVNVPDKRRPEQTRLEVRYSPTLAGAMVDALPYLADYPYGCTEQTLNRFLPTVITQNILKRMNLDLAAIKEKRTNLNAQEIGDDRQRSADWQRLTKGSHGKDWNPVFDAAEVELMAKVGVRDLSAMQLSDGGWGWFSGWGEHSYPHTTAVVVHGLQLAEANGLALLPEVLPRGVAWLNTYQTEQVRLLKVGEEIAASKREPKPGEQYRTQAGDLDALVYMVLVDAGQTDSEMQKFLYRDRTKLSLYSQAMFGLALHKIGANDQRDMVIRNISQFVKTDNENQTTYIDLPNHGSYWWYWYGDVNEANAYYLKLLTATNPQDPQCSGLVKYLLNNRRHATYWNSTRDTAVIIEALAEYLVASGEAEPRMLVEVVVDGEVKQTVEITPEVLFTYDNSFVIDGPALTSGEHKVELRRKPLAAQVGGQKSEVGPLYFNAYLTNFTLEDPITAAGLEIKVGRKFYKLVQRAGAKELSEGARGQAIDQSVLKYDRVGLASLDAVTSGDLVEIELEIDSKNDYEYVIFEDQKAGGFEPVDTQSGYTAGGLGAYVEFRDEKVAFFLRQLVRGKHSVSYRLHAEAPGKFSALPTRGYAMYAPELKANSNEMKVIIEDRPAQEIATLKSDAEYYKASPAQMSPPDGTFPAGTKVTVIRRAGSYSLVRSADGIEAFVATDALSLN